jgi:CubicO group peptidase (beta-lactamase class C family)
VRSLWQPRALDDPRRAAEGLPAISQCLTIAGHRVQMSLHLPNNETLFALIKRRVEEGRAAGIVLGVVNADGTRRIVGYGDPGADYTVEQLYQFLSTYELPREIGSQYEYSNLGMGLLGHVLAVRTGIDYEALVRSRILDPLGMTMTGIALSPAMKAQLAIGRDAEGTPTALWTFPHSPAPAPCDRT